MFKKFWKWLRSLAGQKKRDLDKSAKITPVSDSKPRSNKSHIHHWRYGLFGRRKCLRCGKRQFFSRSIKEYH